MNRILTTLALTAIVTAPNMAAVKEHPVSGSGVHRFTTAIVHSAEPTPTGMIQHSTETVDLTGDMTGRLLYHPTSVFDFVAGTLVNTGHQVFSGTILGSEPLILLDDEFRFEVNLNTGATTGEVLLDRPLTGPKIRCRLTVTGTGIDGNGDATFVYEGSCRSYDKHFAGPELDQRK